MVPAMHTPCTIELIGPIHRMGGGTSLLPAAPLQTGVNGSIMCDGMHGSVEALSFYWGRDPPRLSSTAHDNIWFKRGSC